MKSKIFFTGLLLWFAITTKAQITLDHTYATDGPGAAFKLSLSGLKYFSEHLDFNPGPTYFSVTYFTLYNPDHTIFKTINVPQIPGKRVRDIAYVSETLFDLDSLIEYMYYSNDSTGSDVVVASENGSTLLYVDSAGFTSSSGNDAFKGFIDKPIFPDGNQTKLYLATNSGTKVYNLPGQLSCLECDGGLISGMVINPVVDKQASTAFPNPSNEHFTIKYILPANANSVFLEIFDMQGSLVKKSKLNSKSNQTTVYNNELSAGQFIYRIVADGKVTASDKIIISH